MAIQMSPEEVQEEIKEIREINKRIRAGKEPDLVRKIIEAIDERVLTEQPELSPIEQSRLLFGHSKIPKQ